MWIATISRPALPRVRPATRNNSRATASLRHRKRFDFTTGVAITSSFYPDEATHVEKRPTPAGDRWHHRASMPGTAASSVRV